jgi:FkbM family methyltransferase
MTIIKTALAGWKAIVDFDNRWQILFNRLFFRKHGALIYKKGKLNILIDHGSGDASGTRDCIVSDMYRRYIPMLRADRPLVVIDCGANGGGFPLMLLANGLQLKRLACVEMNPNTFARLRFNISRNVQAEQVVLNAALCSDGRTLALDLGSGGTSDSIYGRSGPEGQPETRHVVNGITLDDLIRRHLPDEKCIDVCKIDIEGAEHEIFASTTCSLASRVKLLIIEIHGSDSEAVARCARRIAALGFAPVESGQGGEGVYCFQNKGDVSACVA